MRSHAKTLPILALATLFLLCSAPPMPTNIGPGLDITVKDGIDTATLNAKMPLTITLNTSERVDSIVILFGDGVQQTWKDNLLSADITHAYDAVGTKTIQARVYLDGNATTYTKDITIVCTTPSLDSILHPDTVLLGKPCLLIAKVTSRVEHRPDPADRKRHGRGCRNRQGWQ